MYRHLYKHFFIQFKIFISFHLEMLLSCISSYNPCHMGVYEQNPALLYDTSDFNIAESRVHLLGKSVNSITQYCMKYTQMVFFLL